MSGPVDVLAVMDTARVTVAELLSIAQRWAAIDGGAWHVERYEAERRELKADTVAAIAKATGATP